MEPCTFRVRSAAPTPGVLDLPLRRSRRAAAAAAAQVKVGDPHDRRPWSGRSWPNSAHPGRGLHRGRERGGGRSRPAGYALPVARVVRRADDPRQRRQLDGVPGRDLRPGPASSPTPTTMMPSRMANDSGMGCPAVSDGRSRAGWPWPADPDGEHRGQRSVPAVPAGAVRWLQGVRLRSGARDGGPDNFLEPRSIGLPADLLP